MLVTPFTVAPGVFSCVALFFMQCQRSWLAERAVALSAPKCGIGGAARQGKSDFLLPLVVIGFALLPRRTAMGRGLSLVRECWSGRPGSVRGRYGAIFHFSRLRSYPTDRVSLGFVPTQSMGSLLTSKRSLKLLERPCHCY